MIAADHDLDALFKRLHLAKAACGATSCTAPSGRRGPIAISSRCWSPKRSPIGNRHVLGD